MGTFTGVMPLRAVAFQIMFLLLAIAIEGVILQVQLRIPRKLSMQYAATTNLLATAVGWMIFFIVEPLLSADWRKELIGYVFFGIKTIPVPVILVGFGMFLGTFLLKLQGVEWLDMVLEKAPVEKKTAFEPGKYRGRQRVHTDFQLGPNRPLAILWANAASFSAISLLLAIRLFVH
jgi:uncharacterized protein YacL